MYTHIGTFNIQIAVSVSGKVEDPCRRHREVHIKQHRDAGDSPAPIKCAVQMETLGRYCYANCTGTYQYRDSCTVVPLVLIDAVAASQSAMQIQ